MTEDHVIVSEATIGDDIIMMNIIDDNCSNKSNNINNNILNGESNLININFDYGIEPAEPSSSVSAEVEEAATEVKFKLVKTKRQSNI